MAALLAGCRDGRAEDDASPGPPADAALPAFYRAPDDLADHQPGDLLRAEVVDVALEGVTAWRVLYRSEGVDGGPIAVSGLVVAPISSGDAAGPAGDGGERPVLGFAHGTTGIGDACAPSRRLAAGAGTLVDRLQLSALAAVASNGWVVAATDYEGLGTAGVHPFGVGDSAGRAVLDSVRAARQLPGTGAGPGSPAMVWGYSQGGGAVLFAAELARAHAPELRLVGAVATAPAAELRALTGTVLAGPNLGLGILTVVGFAAAYPQIDLRTVLTPEGRALAERARTECVEAIAIEASGSSAERYLAVDPTAEGAFADLLEENSPGRRPTAVPVLVVHGDADELVPVATSEALVRRMCGSGDTTVHRIVYPRADHASVVISSAGDVARWLRDRLAGTPAQTDC